MSDVSQGEGWWIASNGKWYPPEQHPDYQPPAPPPPTPPAVPPVVEPQRWAAPTSPAPAAQQHQPTAFETPTTPPVVADIEQLSTGSRGLGRWLPFALVSLVVLGGAAFLINSLMSSSSAIGADSPEDALAGMVEAMDEEDALGIASLVDPQEFSAVTSALERLEADGVDLQGLPGGLDFTMHGLGGPGTPVEARFTQLGPERAGLMVARVDGMKMGLTRADDTPWAFVAYDPDEVFAISAAEIDVGSYVDIEMRAVGGGIEVTGEGDVNGDILERSTEFTDDVPLELVFIEHDGKWFMSLSYTAVNLAVQADALPEPDYGRWRDVLDQGTGGAESPTGAVERMFDALPALDVEELVLSMDPVEARLLYDYLAVLQREAEREIETLQDEAQIEIIALDLSETIDGDTARVFIDRVVIRATDEYGDVTTVELDRNWCGYVEDDDGREGGCLDDLIEEAQREFDLELGTDLDIDLRDLIPDRPLLVTTRREGRWYVSPLATFVEYGRELEPLADGIAGEIERQLGTDTGLVEAVQATPGSTSVTVPGGSSVGVVVTADRTDFGPPRNDLAFHAVSLTTDGDVTVQHNVERSWDDEVRNDVRMFAGEALELVVYTENGAFPRSNAIVLHNRSDGDVDIVVDVAALEVVEIEGPEPYTAMIDDDGTPIVVVALDWFTMQATGVGLTAFDFERLPWVEVRESSRVDDTYFVIVTGEPGAAFTLADGG